MFLCTLRTAISLSWARVCSSSEAFAFWTFSLSISEGTTERGWCLGGPELAS
jgi:hypothetical protein